MKITHFNNFSENDRHSYGPYLSSSERRAWIFQPWTGIEPWHLQYRLSYEPVDIRYISPTCMFITHRLTSAGSLIKWYNRTIVNRGYPPSDLISVVWFYCDERKTDERKTKKRANAQAKLFIGRGKQTKKSFCRSQRRRNQKAGWQFRTEKRDKIHKICTNDPSSFALRNYSEGYKINRPLSGLLVYRRIIPSAESRSFGSPPTWVHFFGQSFSIVLRYTSRRNGFTL